VPQKALMRLLAASDIEDGGMTDTPSSPIVSVYLWYDKAWLTEELVACLGATIQWVFNKSSTYSAGRVSLTVSAGSDLAAKDQAEIVATCDAELRSLFADMKGATLMHGLVIKERHATPLIEPGVQRVGTDGLMNVVGSVAIAGDWTDTGLPATIEGAARSGVKAVEWLSASTTLQRSS
jgi:hydroxysqualene dehydroxylase